MIRTLTLVLFAVTIASTADAQPVDLSGTWAIDESRSGSVGQEGYVGPVTWVLKESPGAIVLERNRGGKVLTFEYRLANRPTDGSADTPVVAPSGEAPGHRARWEGSRLVLETLQEIQGKTVTTREVLVLSPDGRELWVERVLEVEHGYTMKGAQNFNTVKDVFTRK